jgi:UPF0716 protein FxsA
MSMLKWALIGLLALPAAELAGFLLVAIAIGWLWATLAVVSTSALGIVLLRRTGRHALGRLTEALRHDGIAALRLDSPAVASLLGAALLVLPGFITDVVGGALFLPPFRKWAASTLENATRAARQGHHGGDPIIDLDPDEWHRMGDQQRVEAERAQRGSERENKGAA